MLATTVAAGLGSASAALPAAEPAVATGEHGETALKSASPDGKWIVTVIKQHTEEAPTVYTLCYRIQKATAKASASAATAATPDADADLRIPSSFQQAPRSSSLDYWEVYLTNSAKCVWSPGGKYLAIVEADDHIRGTVMLVSFATGTPVQLQLPFEQMQSKSDTDWSRYRIWMAGVAPAIYGKDWTGANTFTLVMSGSVIRKPAGTSKATCGFQLRVTKENTVEIVKMQPLRVDKLIE